MFSSKTVNKKINKAHKGALQALHEDNSLSFDKCLMKEAGKVIYVTNLHKPMLEVFKTLNHLDSSYLWDLFNVKQVEYNMRTKNLVMLPHIKTQTHGANLITFRGSILWNVLTDDIKACANMAAFKKKM